MQPESCRFRPSPIMFLPSPADTTRHSDCASRQCAGGDATHAALAAQLRATRPSCGETGECHGPLDAAGVRLRLHRPGLVLCPHATGGAHRHGGCSAAFRACWRPGSLQLRRRACDHRRCGGAHPEGSLFSSSRMELTRDMCARFVTNRCAPVHWLWPSSQASPVATACCRAASVRPPAGLPPR